ncbi:MAG: Pyridoxal phosphate-containing protein YggS [Olavius algarvensis Delta 4 endosymbiont]|nr:MAG: Pyridoxal phosphate-containing protein YggS [Olavius algarvensis Delta 4 endosymbiont]
MKDRIEQIQKRISAAAEKAGRSPDEIRLVAVSKAKPGASVQMALDAGLDLFGENYIQEAREKVNALSASGAQWHFIGHLQSNKAKYAVKLFDLIHSVDSLKLARELNKQAARIDKVQPVLVQVNISAETTKSGTSREEAVDLATAISDLPNLSLQGLMTMPPFFDDPDRARPYFHELRQLRDHIRSLAIPGVTMDELSMGMTGDFEAAISEGATLVRIGTAIFGERS